MYEWMWRLPWSGNVSQDLLQGWFSPRTDITIAGDAALEGRIVREVASYGSQLGTLIDAVLAIAGEESLSGAAQEKVHRLQELRDKVEGAKQRDQAELERAARDALERLRQADAAAAARLAAGYSSTRKNQ